MKRGTPRLDKAAPYNSVATAVRDALRCGAQDHAQIRAMFPDLSRNAIRKSLTGMLTSGAVHRIDGRYELDSQAQTEEGYRAFILELRRASALARGGRQSPVVPMDRAAAVGDVLRASW